jgi:hypothetical protein
MKPVLDFLNIFVGACHYLNHILGYGWGTLAFLVILAFVLLLPGHLQWKKHRESGMASEEAAKSSSWLAGLGFVLFLVIALYVLSHGGLVSH